MIPIDFVYLWPFPQHHNQEVVQNSMWSTWSMTRCLKSLLFPWNLLWVFIIPRGWIPIFSVTPPPDLLEICTHVILKGKSAFKFYGSAKPQRVFKNATKEQKLQEACPCGYIGCDVGGLWDMGETYCLMDSDREYVMLKKHCKFCHLLLVFGPIQHKHRYI